MSRHWERDFKAHAHDECRHASFDILRTRVLEDLKLLWYVAGLQEDLVQGRFCGAQGSSVGRARQAPTLQPVVRPTQTQSELAVQFALVPISHASTIAAAEAFKKEKPVQVQFRRPQLLGPRP
jgi:hypothetical protein